MSHYDPTSSIGQVRLLIADTDPDRMILEDGEITALLALEGDDPKLAAAQALDTIASSEALVSKVIRTQDLSTDGAKVAAALREHAARLRQQAEQVTEDADHYFEVVDFDPEAWIERLP